MKRRNFIVNAIMGAVGANLASCSHKNQDAPSLAQSADQPQMPQYKLNKFVVGTKKLNASDKIVLAQIGAGGWGTNLALETGKLKANAEFKYICDVDDTRGGRAVDELGKMQGYQPQKVRDMRTVFDDKDVDAVIIATPTHWHTLAALWAMQAGKDVYVEKCITHKLAEGQILAEAAMKYGRILQCGLQNRSAPYNAAAKEAIATGLLGRLVNVTVNGLLNGPVPFDEKPEQTAPEHIDWDMWLGPAPKVPYSVSRNKSWLSYWDYSAGESFEDLVHNMDLTRYVLGDPGLPKSVCSVGGRLALDDNREVPDIQSVVYDFGSFAMNVLAGDFTPYLYKAPAEIRHGDGFPDWSNNGDKIVFYGTEAMMLLGRMGGGWQVIGRNGEILKQMPGRFPLPNHLQNYLDCIRSREIPNANIVQGHLSSSMLHLANISLKLGNKQIEIDPDSESIKNNPEANELMFGTYRPGFELTKAV